MADGLSSRNAVSRNPAARGGSGALGRGESLSRTKHMNRLNRFNEFDRPQYAKYPSCEVSRVKRVEEKRDKANVPEMCQP
jgi:hypothetical protein